VHENIFIPLIVMSGSELTGFCMRKDDDIEDTSDLVESSIIGLLASVLARVLSSRREHGCTWLFVTVPLTLFAEGLTGACCRFSFGLRLQFLIEELEVASQRLSWFSPKSIFEFNQQFNKTSVNRSVLESCPDP